MSSNNSAETAFQAPLSSDSIVPRSKMPELSAGGRSSRITIKAGAVGSEDCKDLYQFQARYCHDI